MAQRQSERLKKLHSEARLEFDRISAAVSDVREQCRQDRRFSFVTGGQWEGKLGAQFENKPKFEINKIQLSIIRIYNEYRNNRITVDFISKDGTDNEKLASSLDSLYRSTEQDSDANEAYDNAFDEACAGGMGAWRLRAEYEDEYDEENEKQQIVIEPIYDADTSVYFDLDSKRYDKADAKSCFVLSSYTYESFKEEFDEDPVTWQKDMIKDGYYDWVTINIVYVAEYYKVEEVRESIYIYKTIDGQEEKYKDTDFDNDENLEQTLAAIGTTLERERKIKTRKIHKYIMSGNSILEDCGFVAGKHIPIVPMYGKRVFIENIERMMGHTRLAKDAQRLKNMQTSKLAEIAALSTVSKPIFTPEQMQGLGHLWEEDNVKNHAYMLINTMTDVNGQKVASGPLGYTKSPEIPPATAALLQITDNDIKEILGNQEQGEKITPNASGKAIELIQSKLDMQTFIYMSNMAKSMKRSGEIWLSMAQELFVEEGRVMKTVGAQDEVSSIELLKPVTNPDTLEVTHENDLASIQFKVAVDVGPSSTSMRAATVKALTGMMQLTQDPETLQVLTSMALMNMEGEGLADSKDFFRKKMLRIGAVKPTDSEKKEMEAEAANQQPDPNAQFMAAAAQEAEAKAAKARADTVLMITKSEQTQADTEKTKAETMETLSNIETGERQQAIEALQSLDQFAQQSPGPSA